MSSANRRVSEHCRHVENVEVVSDEFGGESVTKTVWGDDATKLGGNVIKDIAKVPFRKRVPVTRREKTGLIRKFREEAMIIRKYRKELVGDGNHSILSHFSFPNEDTGRKGIIIGGDEVEEFLAADAGIKEGHEKGVITETDERRKVEEFGKQVTEIFGLVGSKGFPGYLRFLHFRNVVKRVYGNDSVAEEVSAIRAVDFTRSVVSDGFPRLGRSKGSEKSTKSANGKKGGVG